MIKRICTILLLGGFTAVAQANDTVGNYQPETLGRLFVCNLRGQVSGTSTAIIIGGEQLAGPGHVTCVNNKTRRRVTMPVTIRITGRGLGLDMTTIHRLDLITAGITTDDPVNFVDSYGFGVSGGASLIHARIGFDIAVRATRNDGAGFEIGLRGAEVTGLGMSLYAMTFEISPR